MKIINGALITFSALAVLLTMTFATPAQIAAPTATPKSAGDTFGDALDDLENFGHRDQAEIYFRRGRNCDAKKDYACAIENYSGAIKADPFNARFFFLRGKAEMNLFRDADAIADLNRDLAKEPKNDAAFLDLAIIYETTGQYDKAIDAYRSAVKAVPTPTNYILLARGINRIFKKLSDTNQIVPASVDLNEALNALNAALKLEPNEPVNYLEYQERAITYRNLARTGKPFIAAAEADEKKANEQMAVFIKQVTAKTEAVVAAKEKDLVFERSLTPFFAARDFAAVVKLTTDAISQDPAKFRIYDDRAQGYIGLRKYGEAIADASKAIEISPTFSESYSIRGLAKMRGGDFSGAVADFDHAVDLDPANEMAILNRGRIYMYQGKYELAEIDLRLALDLRPGNQVAASELTSLADLRTAGYNTGKVKDDALLKYVGINNLIIDYSESVNDGLNIYVKATNEQPRDNAKVCRLLGESSVAVMVLESLADKMKELVNTGGLDKLPAYKRSALTTLENVATFRPTIDPEFAKQGCKK